MLRHSHQWNQNESCYAGSSRWTQDSIEVKLTACCKLFRSIFSYDNIDDIFHIMKYSLGQEIPIPLKNLTEMKAEEHVFLFPNNGDFSGLRESG